MRVEREHAFVFILRNGFLENSLEGLEVQQGIYVGVYEINIWLPSGCSKLNDANDCEYEPNVVIQIYNWVKE